MLQNATPLRKSAPDTLQMPHACLRFWKCYKPPPFCSLLTRCTIPRTCHAKRALNFQKWSEHVVFFNILTLKCASRHNGMHFFDIATSKSGPNLASKHATTACNFSSLICPGGSAPAALASLLFDPPEPQIIGKTQCFATFLPFCASAASFF